MFFLLKRKAQSISVEEAQFNDQFLRWLMYMCFKWQLVINLNAKVMLQGTKTILRNKKKELLPIAIFRTIEQCFLLYEVEMSTSFPINQCVSKS